MAGGFDWRVSSASVVEDGAFSSFPDHERFLVVLDKGKGLKLFHQKDNTEKEEEKVLLALEPYAFSGSWTTRCELLQGKLQDFNLMVRRDFGRGSLVVNPAVIEHEQEQQASFLFVASGGPVLLNRQEDGATVGKVETMSGALVQGQGRLLLSSSEHAIFLIASVYPF